MKVAKRAAPSCYSGLRGTGAGSWNVVMAALMAPSLAVAANPPTYELRSGVCPGGVCQDVTADGVCAQYANERIRYSQSNPNDHNKWVAYDELETDVPGEPDGQRCVGGTCYVVLRAQSGYTQGYSPYISACVDVVEDDTTKDEQSCKSNPPFGNPIFPLEGRKRESVSLDLGLAGLPGAIAYDSGRRLPTSAEVGVPSPDATAPSFGELWYGTWHRKVLPAADLKSAQVSRGDGRFVSFVGDGSGAFTAVAQDTDVRLSLVGDQFQYVDPRNGGIETYRRDGLLNRISTAEGRLFVFTHSDASTPSNVAPGSGYLTRVADTFGRQMAFIYAANESAIRLVRGPGLPGEHDVDDDADDNDMLPSIKATYDGNKNLATLVWQDGKTKTFKYEALLNFKWVAGHEG